MLSPRTPSSRFSVVALTALAVVGLTGCASAPQTDAVTTTDRPAPAIDTAAEPVDLAPPVPSVSYDIDCAGLVPADVVSTALGFDGIAAKEPDRDGRSPMYMTSPWSLTVRHVGGLECSWSNDEPEVGADGVLNPAYESVDVILMPDSGGRFAEVPYQDAIEVQFGDGSATGCAGTGACSVDVAAAGSWLRVEIIGLDVGPGATEADALEQATPLIQAIIDGIPEPNPSSKPVTGTANCELAAPDEDILLALDITGGWKAVGRTGGGPYALWEASRDYAGTHRCIAGPIPGDQRAIDTKILPGGAWVFRPGEMEKGVAMGREPVTISGTSTPDSYLACTVGEEGVCTVDMAIGADWVSITLWNGDPFALPPTTEQDRADMLALASHIAANLT